MWFREAIGHGATRRAVAICQEKAFSKARNGTGAAQMACSIRLGLVLKEQYLLPLPQAFGFGGCTESVPRKDFLLQKSQPPYSETELMGNQPTLASYVA